MRWLAVLFALLVAVPAHAKGGGLFSKIKYGVGINLHAGVGAFTGEEREIIGLGEALGFEFRSYFGRHVGTHTTLNLLRTTVDAANRKARLDYDCHVAFYIPRGERADFVIAPGFSIAYTFDASQFARYGGGWRMGVDLHTRGRTSVGLYARPFFAWLIRDAPGLPDDRDAGYHIGAMADLVVFWRVGKKWDIEGRPDVDLEVQ